MKAFYGLELVQTQRLSLTPEMRQAITVLQMNALELREFLISQAEENPLIELVDNEYETALPGEAEPSEEDLLAYFRESSEAGADLARNTEPRKDRLVDIISSDNAISLKDHLFSQLGLMSLSLAELAAAEAIIGSIDDNGYFRATTGEVAALCGQPESVVCSMLKLVQSFDPPGVGASDLRECLLIQAKSKGLGALVENLIARHLDDLAAARYKKIAREERISLAKVLTARDAILSLDPKPGSRFSDGGVTYIVPEIAIRKVDGRFEVILSDRAVPRLRWNPFYRNLAKMGEAQAKEYLSREIKRAQALFRCIEQRRATIKKVMEAIARRQEAFLDKGPGHLEPLTLKDVSDEIGVHESTVSRALANKYVDTPHGVFPCRAFFSPRVTAGGRVYSQDEVKAAISEIVRTEDRQRPLGDQEICAELERRGMLVARRTVSKYRSQLGIMPKNKRKGT